MLVDLYVMRNRLSDRNIKEVCRRTDLDYKRILAFVKEGRDIKAPEYIKLVEYIKEELDEKD